MDQDSLKDTATHESRRERRESQRRKGGGALEFILILVIAFALVFGVVRPFIAEAFYIPSESMVPTLEINDRVLAAKFPYYFTTPDRGDVVVFESVESSDDLIKRVVGLPGDTIAVQGSTLFLNGEPQQEPYIADGGGPGLSTFGPIEVPEGHYFMMGDNRGNSRDSREFGPIPEENLVGDAFVLFWPLNRMGTL